MMAGPPSELVEATTLDGIAQRYGLLPSEVRRLDSENLRIANTVMLWEREQTSG